MNKKFGLSLKNVILSNTFDYYYQETVPNILVNALIKNVGPWLNEFDLVSTLLVLGIMPILKRGELLIWVVTSNCHENWTVKPIYFLSYNLYHDHDILCFWLHHCDINLKQCLEWFLGIVKILYVLLSKNYVSLASFYLIFILLTTGKSPHRRRDIAILLEDFPCLCYTSIA